MVLLYSKFTLIFDDTKIASQVSLYLQIKQIYLLPLGKSRYQGIIPGMA